MPRACCNIDVFVAVMYQVQPPKRRHFVQQKMHEILSGEIENHQGYDEFCPNGPVNQV